MKPLLIETPRQMDALLDQLADEKLLAVDTEFFRETTYYPELALVQIATDSVVACIDPLAFDARPALKTLLLDNSITKIFHSCSQDLEVLFYYLGEIPNTIYDTQIANALLSEHHQIGYASLVENELGTQLDKSQTRTNWLQRPLTEKQIQYAGDDVLYLYQLHHKLDKKLQDNERKAWLDEECHRLSNTGNTFQVETTKLWRRVKGATRLKRKDLASVQAIAEWREQVAQHRNKTRRKVLDDDTLIKIALSAADSTDNLKQSLGHQQRFDNEELQNLLDIISAARQKPESQWPDNRFNALEPQQKTLLKAMQQVVSNKAEELGISSAIICSKKDLETMILQQGEQDDGHTQPSIAQGWRLSLIGQPLKKLLIKP